MDICRFGQAVALWSLGRARRRRRACVAEHRILTVYRGLPVFSFMYVARLLRPASGSRLFGGARICQTSAKYLHKC